MLVEESCRVSFHSHPFIKGILHGLDRMHSALILSIKSLQVHWPSSFIAHNLSHTIWTRQVFSSGQLFYAAVHLFARLAYIHSIGKNIEKKTIPNLTFTLITILDKVKWILATWRLACEKKDFLYACNKKIEKRNPCWNSKPFSFSDSPYCRWGRAYNYIYPKIK